MDLQRMKYLIITGVFIVGMSLGYLVGTRSVLSGNSDDSKLVSQNDLVNTNETSSKSDRKLNAAESTLEELENENDTLRTTPSDSLLVEFMQADSLNDDENISTEKLTKSLYIPIIYLSEETSKDTLMEEMLGIEEVKASSMFVEFWESPLNFEGYKLSKKKLIVYGLSSQFDYKVYKDGTTYFFSYQNIYYKMKETQDFLPFVEVSKSDVFS
jgi:hypothetical protein